MNFTCYVDMDGVLNHFESDKNARLNMWKPGYFLTISVREGMVEILERINQNCSVVILSKIINRIGVTEEKDLWLHQNISSEAYSDVIYVPYDRSKSDYICSHYPSMLIDDNETNLDECAKKGCHGLFLSDIKISQKYPNVRNLEDILDFYYALTQRL